MRLLIGPCAMSGNSWITKQIQVSHALDLPASHQSLSSSHCTLHWLLGLIKKTEHNHMDWFNSVVLSSVKHHMSNFQCSKPISKWQSSATLTFSLLQYWKWSIAETSVILLEWEKCRCELLDQLSHMLSSRNLLEMHNKHHKSVINHNNHQAHS